MLAQIMFKNCISTGVIFVGLIKTKTNLHLLSHEPKRTHPPDEEYRSDSVTFSSSVTIYSDFHFNQDVDLLHHVTSCLWRVSQRMALITFWVRSDLSSSTTIRHTLPRIDSECDRKTFTFSETSFPFSPVLLISGQNVNLSSVTSFLLWQSPCLFKRWSPIPIYKL